ncbi:MAG: hypothetical protein IJ606_01785 [Bacteroidaceae bacterium]|nr:hypothetical protein [Bacteroidaceae bacterium]
MKQRLDQYTIAQFIDIISGDLSSIDADGEAAAKIASSLVEQYNVAADPVSAKAQLSSHEKDSKNDAKIKLYRILLNLINVFGAYDEVRDILCLAKQGNVAKREDKSLKSKIEQMLRTEEALQERSENEKRGNDTQDVAESVRASFDSQTARLMAHFKFSISHETMSASIYANLVKMACKEQRRKAG